jgi:hypothetical protein
MQPSARPRIELEVEGLCLQADEFPTGGSYARRSALSVHSAELRDCDPRPEGGPGWRKILAYHATSHTPRDAHACLLQVPQLCTAQFLHLDLFHGQSLLVEALSQVRSGPKGGSD